MRPACLASSRRMVRPTRQRGRSLRQDASKYEGPERCSGPDRFWDDCRAYLRADISIVTLFRFVARQVMLRLRTLRLLPGRSNDWKRPWSSRPTFSIVDAPLPKL